MKWGFIYMAIRHDHGGASCLLTGVRSMCFTNETEEAVAEWLLL